jgi:hypothetical protein
MPKQSKKKQPEFLDRIENPEKYPVIKRDNGNISTHRMSAEVDENGNWFVFPNIVMLESGELYEFEDSQQAMQYNLKNNNFLPMPSKKEAIDYAKGGYKTPKFIEFGKNYNKPL